MYHWLYGIIRKRKKLKVQLLHYERQVILWSKIFIEKIRSSFLYFIIKVTRLRPYRTRVHQSVEFNHVYYPVTGKNLYWHKGSVSWTVLPNNSLLPWTYRKVLHLREPPPPFNRGTFQFLPVVGKSFHLTSSVPKFQLCKTNLCNCTPRIPMSTSFVLRLVESFGLLELGRSSGTVLIPLGSVCHVSVSFSFISYHYSSIRSPTDPISLDWSPNGDLPEGEGNETRIEVLTEQRNSASLWCCDTS